MFRWVFIESILLLADQLRGNREADQRLCFRYSDSIIPLLLKPEIQASSSFL